MKRRKRKNAHRRAMRRAERIVLRIMWTKKEWCVLVVGGRVEVRS